MKKVETLITAEIKAIFSRSLFCTIGRSTRFAYTKYVIKYEIAYPNAKSAKFVASEERNIFFAFIERLIKLYVGYASVKAATAMSVMRDLRLSSAIK